MESLLSLVKLQDRGKYKLVKGTNEIEYDVSLYYAIGKRVIVFKVDHDNPYVFCVVYGQVLDVNDISIARAHPFGTYTANTNECWERLKDFAQYA